MRVNKQAACRYQSNGKVFSFLTPPNDSFSLILLIFFILIFNVPPSALAGGEQDISGNVQLNSSRLMYDRLAKVSYLDVTLKNISQNAYPTPVKVVITNMSDASVTVKNADGTTPEGKPYFTYTTPTGQFPSGGSIAAKRWVFNNPKAARLSYSCAVYVSGTRVAVALPPGISSSNVAIQTPDGSFTLNPDGTFTMATLLPGPFLVAAKVQGVPVALSFFNPQIPGNAISCLETAVSLVMLSNMLFTVPSQLIPDTLALIRSVPEVQTLGGVICQKLSERTDALVAADPALTSALNNAARAVDNALKAL